MTAISGASLLAAQTQAQVERKADASPALLQNTQAAASKSVNTQLASAVQTPDKVDQAREEIKKRLTTPAKAATGSTGASATKKAQAEAAASAVKQAPSRSAGGRLTGTLLNITA